MTDNDSLFFREMGQGPGLLILHGFLGLSDHWVPLGKYLSQRFRVIIPDLRNHGRSPHSEAFSWDEMQADVLTLLNRLGLSRVSTIGHSMGGRLAMHLALDYPQCIENLQVVDISPMGLPEHCSHQNLIRVMMNLDLAAFNRLSEVSAVLSDALPDERWVQFCLKNIRISSSGTMAWKPNLKVLRNAWPALAEPLLADHTFPGPVLFLKGEDSHYLQTAELPGIRKLFPEAEMLTIPKAGHWIHADNPPEFYNATIKFLTRGGNLTRPD